MDSISFNDTLDYKHMRILGREGVFTQANIDLHSLPKDYHPYRILGDKPGAFTAISANDPDSMTKTGLFITKTALTLDTASLKPLQASDIVHLDRVFSMEDYFGVKESIDLQIALADNKRRQQSSNEPDLTSVSRQGEVHSDHDLILDVADLSDAQFSELKENYWHDILPESDLSKYPTPGAIPDQVILQHYKHTTFTPADFSTFQTDHELVSER